MKKSIITIALAILLGQAAFAQKPFTKIYELKVPVSIEQWESTDDETRIVAGDMAEICGIDAVAGKVIWTIKTKEKFGVKRAEKWSYDTETGIVEFQCKGDKKSEMKTYLVDDATGEVLSSDAAQRPKRQHISGLGTFRLGGKSWEGKGSLHLEDPNVDLELSYERPTMNASFGRNKKSPITVSCSGEHTWSTTVQGSFVRALCDNAFGSDDDFGGDFIDIKVYGDVVFVQYEGLSVIDLKTGKLLWETTFDYSSFDFGLLKSEMIIGRAPMPVCDGGAAYIADLSKETRAIRKFDLRTGKVLWQSERLSKDAIITQMEVINGVLIVRNGGEVLVQKLITNGNTGAQTCISEMKEEGDFSLNAYDTNTGKALWVADDLKALGDKFKSISNLESDGTYLYVTSEKNLFALDPKTGAAKWKTDVAKMKIGKPRTVYFLNEDIVIDAEEGIARCKSADGSTKYSTNTDKNLGWFYRGDVFYLWTGKKPEERNKFIRFNIETGAIEGGIEDTFNPYFSPDGNEFIKKDDNSFLRFKTN